MSRSVLATLSFCALFVTLESPTARAAKPWELLIPFKHVEADQQKEYRLTEDQGPWMVMATSFAGPGAADQAQRLVLELRKEFNVEAYIHQQSYDFTEPVVGLGVNPHGGPKMMRYANEAKFDEIAVLVGSFQTVDDPKLDALLDELKHARPDCLDISKNKTTTQRFIGLRELHRRLSGDQAKREKGPMANAFVTRNPLLPQEYFVPKGLDPLVESMNRDVEHSLLDNPGKYTVRIATFRGASMVEVNKRADDRGASSKLEEAAVKAHELTAALRKKGVPAYEFHDRHESIVTVGSFESVGSPRPDGKTEIHPAVYQIMNKYGPQRQQLPGQTAFGLVPHTVNGIACDIQPIPVEVPKVSVAAAYTARNQLFR